MKPIDLFLGSALAQAIGWALLHLLWQGTLIAGIAAALFALMRERSATARYAVGCAALALMLAFPIATAWRVYERDLPLQSTTAAPVAQTAPVEVLQFDSAKPDVTIPLTLETVKPLIKQRLERMFRPVVPWTFAIWLTGVLFLSARFAGGLLQAQRLCRIAQAASAHWQKRLAHLSERMALTTPIRLLESARVEVPLVVGWLRPVVIMPITAITGLSGQQLETILAHELAHIRRNDYLVNLLQGVVETLLFYHPAVWWLSYRVRAERENCCDDLAVAVCGNAVLYARALADLEELRIVGMRHAVAANGGSLKGRVVRLVVGREGKSRCSYRWITGVSVFTAAALLVVVAPLSLLASRHTLPPAPAPTPKPVATPHVPMPPATPEADASCPSKHVGTSIEVTAPRVVDETTPTGEVDLTADVPEPDVPEVVITPEVQKAIDRATMIAMAAPRALPVPSVGAVPAVAPVAPTPYVRLSPVQIEAIKAAALTNVTPVVIAERQRIVTKDGKVKFVTVAHDGCNRWDGKLTVDQLIELRQSGVDAKFINDIRELGYGNLCFEELIELRRNGVSAETLAQLKNAGLDELSARDLLIMAQQGVTADYIKGMKDAGVGDLSARNLIALRTQGVDPEYVRNMYKSGFDDLSSQDLVTLRVNGVTPEFMKELASYGIDNFDAREIAALRANGVDGAFIKSAKDAGYDDLSVRDLIRLRNSGVDPDYLRELAKGKK